MPQFGNLIADNSDALSVATPGGKTGARFDYMGRPRAGTTGAPTAVIGANAGTGASFTAAVGSDSAGNLTYSTGTSPAAGTMLTVTFNTPYLTAPFVQVEPKDAAGASAVYYVTSSTTGFVLKSVNAPAASTAMSVDYMVVGGV